MFRLSGSKRVGLILAAVLFAVPSALAQNWPTFGFVPAGGRYNTAETKISTSNVGSLAPIWNFTGAGTYSASSAAVVGGVAYVASGDGEVYALNATTGAQLWKFPAEPTSAFTSSPAVSNGVVYVANYGATVYAINATTGAEVWSTNLDGYVYASPTVANGIVYIACTYQVGSCPGLYALNASTGAKIWNFAAGSTFDFGAPAVANGVVYAAAGGTLYALNASTGAEEWSFPTSNSTATSPAVVGGVVYFGGVPAPNVIEPFAYAVNASTGKKLWSVSGSFGYQASGSPAVANGVVYLATTGSPNGLYALNASTGATLWTFADGDYGSPAVANGIVYVCSPTSVYALNPSTGAMLWHYTWSSGGGGTETIANGVLYSGWTAFAP